MKIFTTFLMKYFPLTLGVGIIIIGSFFVPWHDVWPYLTALSPLSIVILLTLGITFYLARILRYGYILNTLNEPLSFGRLTLSYLVGQPVSLLPAGEMYRSLMFKKHGEVAMRNSVPSVFVQSFTENVGLVVIALISAIILNKYILLVLIVALVNFSVLGIIRRQEAIHKSHSLLQRIPFINISKRRYRMFMGRNQKLLSGTSLIVLLASSVVSTMAASAALFVSAQNIGVELTFIQSIVAFSLPLILQNISFLPGGLGINEQSSVGVLLLLNVNLPAAVALTLIIRFLTLGFGLLLGLVAIAYTKLSDHEKS